MSKENFEEPAEDEIEVEEAEDTSLPVPGWAAGSDDKVKATAMAADKTEKSKGPNPKSTIFGQILFQLFVYFLLGMITYASMFRELHLEEFEKTIITGMFGGLMTLLNVIAVFHLGSRGREE